MNKKVLASLFLMVPVGAFAAGAKDNPVLITVNGVEIRRADAMERAWKQQRTAVVNEMADEILIRQAAQALKIKPDAKDVDARIKRIQGQVTDEAAFQKNLAALRAQIEDQVLREDLVERPGVA